MNAATDPVGHQGMPALEEISSAPVSPGRRPPEVRGGMATAALRAEGRTSPGSSSRRRSTPSRLRRSEAALVVLAILAAALGLTSVLGRQAAIASARSGAEPLLAEAQTAITALSDADATQAGAFLAGRVAPAGAAARYGADLAGAAGAISAASHQALTGPEATSVRTLATGLPVYSGVVQTAVADQRQGLPVAASYLSEASGFLRGALVPAAAGLFAHAQARLATATASARASTTDAAAAAVGVLFAVGALLLQFRMVRRFRRVLNPAALLATIAAVGAIAWSGSAVAAEGGRVTAASHRGSTPLRLYAEARILVLQARADDELTLVSRDAVPAYQADYASLVPRISALLAGPDPSGTDAATLGAARSEWAKVQGVHAAMRREDGGGDLVAAISTSDGSGSGDLPATSSALDSTLEGAIQRDEGTFSRDLADAGGDLGPLPAGAVALWIAAGALVAYGVEKRIAEYR